MEEDRYKRYKERYEKYLPTYPFTLLDLGCGRMNHTKFFNFSECTAVDIRDQFWFDKNIKYVQSDLLDFLEKNNTSYDVVVILHVLEHLEKNDAKKLIIESKKITKDTLIVETPEGFHDTIDFQDVKYMRHICGFSKADLKNLGLKVEELTNAGIKMKKKIEKKKITMPESWNYLLGVWRRK